MQADLQSERRARDATGTHAATLSGGIRGLSFCRVDVDTKDGCRMTRSSACVLDVADRLDLRPRHGVGRLYRRRCDDLGCFESRAMGEAVEQPRAGGEECRNDVHLDLVDQSGADCLLERDQGRWLQATNTTHLAALARRRRRVSQRAAGLTARTPRSIDRCALEADDARRWVRRFGRAGRRRPVGRCLGGWTASHVAVSGVPAVPVWVPCVHEAVWSCWADVDIAAVVVVGAACPRLGRRAWTSMR
jgi:hypothetical protein